MPDSELIHLPSDSELDAFLELQARGICVVCGENLRWDNDSDDMGCSCTGIGTKGPYA